MITWEREAGWEYLVERDRTRSHQGARAADVASLEDTDRAGAALVMTGAGDRLLTSADLRAPPDRLMALAATPAELWVVIHGGPMDRQVSETVRALAVRPHAPRRYCLVDGAEIHHILKAHRRI